jgi:predicted nucleotidyltransferase
MSNYKPRKSVEILNQKAHKWAQIIGRLPGVVAVFLSGSLAQGQAKSTSDIDFFIITVPGQIWTARFCTNLCLKLTFNLAKPAHHKARICPNHFITANNLEIAEQDAYSAHLFSQNRPLYDPSNLWPQFVEANDWVRAFGEKFPLMVEINGAAVSIPLQEKQNTLFEKIVRWGQLKKIYRNPDFKRPGAKVILKDKELRFHPDPKNQYWRESVKNVDLGKKERQADVEITL